MHGFWTEILVRAWHHLDPPFRRWVGWLTISLAVFGIYWIDQADLIRREWLGYAIGASLLFFLVRALKKAIEDHYRAQMELAAEKTDDVLNLTRRVRDQAEQISYLERQLAGQRRMAANDLTALQTEGINLTAAMARTYLPQQHPQAIARWRQAVEDCITTNSPAHLNGWRMPTPLNPNRHADESERARWEMAERLNRIQVVINALTN